MNFILFDDERYSNFLPLTHTRPVSEMRCGILTITQKWEHHLKVKVSYKTALHLQEKYPLNVKEDNVFINSGLFPSNELLEAILNLQIGQYLLKDNTLLAFRCNLEEANQFNFEDKKSNATAILFNSEVKMLSQVWDIFSLNDWAIRDDFERVTTGRDSHTLNSSNTLIGNQIFIEEGAKVNCSILNSDAGPIYIGKDAEIMEGCIIRGPLALGNHAVLKMGAKIYGATTIGDGCKVGGEVNNSVLFANSSKAHDGFLGNAVLGEWCNLGADTNNSNLKNNYEEVKLWSEAKKTFVKTGLQFCGLIMGDHSKSGINTMFNTGTVVGVSCNVYGAGFPRNFIPSFSWGSANGFMEYKLNKAMDTASRVFARRNIPFDEVEQKIMSHVFEVSQEQRNY
jgi:UDP-N-acetylglucosamine diphosphorylase/glucosamine-1-phosphate N-acetyltransferase